MNFIKFIKEIFAISDLFKIISVTHYNQPKLMVSFMFYMAFERVLQLKGIDTRYAVIIFGRSKVLVSPPFSNKQQNCEQRTTEKDHALLLYLFFVLGKEFSARSFHRKGCFSNSIFLISTYDQSPAFSQRGAFFHQTTSAVSLAMFCVEIYSFIG